jgi:copper chaperone NosL
MTRALLVACVAISACAAGTVGPANIRLGEDACAHCRMTVVSDKTAAQIVAPGAEPLIFDEPGCLRDFLSERALGEDAVVFVADHRTGAWIDARQAVFTRTSERTPMGSGLIAHADAASRDADAAALHGAPVTAGFILQPPAKGSAP